VSTLDGAYIWREFEGELVEGVPTVNNPKEMVPTNLEMKIVGRDILRYGMWSDRLELRLQTETPVFTEQWCFACSGRETESCDVAARGLVSPSSRTTLNRIWKARTTDWLLRLKVQDGGLRRRSAITAGGQYLRPAIFLTLAITLRSLIAGQSNANMDGLPCTPCRSFPVAISALRAQTFQRSTAVYDHFLSLPPTKMTIH